MRQLPQPTASERNHSEELCQIIHAAIAAARGRIAFSQFMQQALYAPRWGYYDSGTEKLGAQGDFVTAPELSPLFARCLAHQCQKVLQMLLAQGVDGEDLTLLELGGGSGRMAAQLLTALAELDQLPARYQMLEVSAALRARQQAYLQQHCPQWIERIEWLDRLPSTPLSGVIIANEVMDALVVERLTLYQGKLQQGFIATATAREFVWQFAEPTQALFKTVQHHLSLTDEQWCQQREGAFFEFSAQLTAWIASLSDCLLSGAMLLSDYGYPRRDYYHPDRRNGTLVCYYKHHCHDDPLILAGLQDITAHVDFTLVAESAAAVDLTVAGFTHQAAFLFNCGLAQMEVALSDPTLAQALRKLLLPGEMGEACKVMALTRNLDEKALIGFANHDRRHQL
ncbi:MAG: SAM-dependent methyltransferase [Gammaproteobacteria bacterium]|nr:SAM-dependent methyltransferase [Gammaproteobacteria bacterium]